MNMKLKLPKITATDPIERLSVGLKQSTVNMLKNYQAAYAEVYGEEIPTSTLVDDIIRRFISEDKAFLKAFNALSKSASKPEQPAAFVEGGQSE